MMFHLFRRTALATMAFSVAFLAVLHDARAEPCASSINESEAPRAAKLVKHAKESLAVGHFAEALALFEQAYCILPEPILKHGISSAELNLGRCGDAVRDARFWVSHAAGEESGEARQWFEELLTQCMEVSIQTSPDDATLRIDGGAPVSAPWLGRLRAGPHAVIASKAGQADTEAKFEVAPGNRSVPLAVTITLLPLPPVPPEVAEVPTGVVHAPPAAPPPTLPLAAPPPPVARNEVPPAATAPAPPPERNNGAFIATWVVLGVAVVGAVLGTSFGASANACPTKVSTPVGVQSALQCQSNNDTAANVSWAIAGASAVTAGGLALSWALPHKSSDQQQVSVGLAPSGAGLALNF